MLGVDLVADDRAGWSRHPVAGDCRLRLVAAGHSNREIAAQLFISIPTVKRHVTNILGKLALPSRSALNTYAHAHGLV